MSLISRSFIADLFPLITLFYLCFSHVAASIQDGIFLKILPLGDSITYGYQTDSTDFNGYREDLLNLLSGNTVQYIGTQSSGSMSNNANEGWPGYEINAIAAKGTLDYSEKPNVVLLMAGTNDINGNDNVSSAPQRLGSLIDGLVAALPDAVVIVAQITPIDDSSAEQRTQTFNAALPAVVQQRASAGKKVLLVNMQNSQNGLQAPGDMDSDGLHPNNQGYAKMAQVWLGGLTQAGNQNLISKATPSASGSAEGACDGKLFWYNTYGTIASGVGDSDKPFTSGWNQVPGVAGGLGNGSNVRIADFNGDGRDDYAILDADTGAVTLYLNGGYNGGNIVWLPQGTVASGLGDAPGAFFADITGDGLADYIWISPTGDMTAYRNGGPGSGGNWIWYPLGPLATSVGARSSIRFADIDGDGRADYHVIDPNSGAMKSFMASGPNFAPTWTSLGQTAGGIGDGAGVRLADLNGDGRADYIHLDENGAATAYINTLGKAAGLVPVWLPAGVIASGVGTSRDNITFGDLDGNGNADYLFVHLDSGAIDMWQNSGSGGAYLAGQEVTFADIDGDGHDDYVSVGPTGALLVYRNGGPNTGANGGWIWIPLGTIASGVAPRENIRLADINGDGKADYLIVDDKTGAVSAYLNGGSNGNANGGWIWNPIGTIASGVGDGPGVKFADFNGDGRADYAWVSEGGATTLYLNAGQNPAANEGWVWLPQGVVATGVGAARDEVRFADLDGDGKAEYLWLSKMTGSVQAWHNGGSSGSGWIWVPENEIASGVGTNGLCVQFGRILGTGRADYAVVDPPTAAVNLWANGCSGGSGSGGGSTPSPTTANPTATPTPTPSAPADTDPSMSCNQFESYLNSLGRGTHETAADWDLLDVSTFFNNFATSSPHTSNFEGALARVSGVGDKWADCTIDNGCPAIECSDFGTYADQPGSAAAYLVLNSMANFQQCIYLLHNDLVVAQNNFDHINAFFTTNFATSTHDNGKDVLVFKEVLTAVSAAVIVGTILIGPEAAAGANVAAGIVSGINNALTTPVVDELETLAELQVYINASITPALNEIETMFNAYRNQGTYQNLYLTDLLSHGAFVYSGDIPYLNETTITASDRQNIMLQHINAAALNWGWRKTRSWAISYPMTQNDFDTTKWYAGNDDSRLRWYDPVSGRGFFLESVWPKSAAFGQNNPTTQNPPGWGNVNDLGFDTFEIMASAWAGFQADGFNASFDPTSWLGTLGDTSGTGVGAVMDSLHAPGVFDLIQCPWPIDNFPASVSDFNTLLSGPGAIDDDNDHGQYPPLCYCINVKDKNGQVAQDFIDIDQWHVYCNGASPVT